MRVEEAYEVLQERDKFAEVSCSCHCGNPPCSKCVDSPSQEEIEQATVIVVLDLKVSELEKEIENNQNTIKSFHERVIKKNNVCNMLRHDLNIAIEQNRQLNKKLDKVKGDKSWLVGSLCLLLLVTCWLLLVL